MFHRMLNSGFWFAMCLGVQLRGDVTVDLLGLLMANSVPCRVEKIWL